MKTQKPVWNPSLRNCTFSLSLNLFFDCGHGSYQQFWKVAQKPRSAAMKKQSRGRLHFEGVFLRPCFPRHGSLESGGGPCCWRKDGLWRQIEVGKERLWLPFAGAELSRPTQPPGREASVPWQWDSAGYSVCSEAGMPFSNAYFRTFRDKNGAMCDAQDTPFPMTRPERWLWSIGHLPG